MLLLITWLLFLRLLSFQSLQTRIYFSHIRRSSPIRKICTYWAQCIVMKFVTNVRYSIQSNNQVQSFYWLKSLLGRSKLFRLDQTILHTGKKSEPIKFKKRDRKKMSYLVKFEFFLKSRFHCITHLWQDFLIFLWYFQNCLPKKNQVISLTPCTFNMHFFHNCASFICR